MADKVGNDWIARIALPDGGAIVLGKDLAWRAEGDGPSLRLSLETAERMRAGYQPAPSDGQPGYAHSARVAKAVGGELEQSPLPPAPPGVIF